MLCHVFSAPSLDTLHRFGVCLIPGGPTHSPCTTTQSRPQSPTTGGPSRDTITPTVLKFTNPSRTRIISGVQLIPITTATSGDDTHTTHLSDINFASRPPASSPRKRGPFARIYRNPRRYARKRGPYSRIGPAFGAPKAGSLNNPSLFAAVARSSRSTQTRGFNTLTAARP